MTNYFNQDAEVSLLSLLMREKDAWINLTTIRAEMFTSLPHKLLFTTMQDLIHSGLHPEYSLLHSTLKSRNLLNEAGGEDYLQFLYGVSSNINNIKEYENLVIKNFKARELLKFSSGIPARLQNTPNIDSLILDVKNTVDDLLTTSVVKKTYHLRDFLDASYETIVARTENLGPSGHSTGYRHFDMMTGGFNPGDLLVICGRPGMAKSAKMCNMTLKMAKNGDASLLFSLEMSKEQLIERMIAIETGIDLTHLRVGHLTETQLEEIKETIEKFKELPIYIDANYMADVNYVETITRMYHKKHDIKSFWVDNINLMVERNTDSTHALGQVSRRCKLLGMELGITSIIIAQLNRNVESRDDKRPRLSDIRQSGNIEEDADIVEGLYRDDFYNNETERPGILEAIILKHRNGPLGIYSLTFKAETNRLSDE